MMKCRILKDSELGKKGRIIILSDNDSELFADKLMVTPLVYIGKKIGKIKPKQQQRGE